MFKSVSSSLLWRGLLAIVLGIVSVVWPGITVGAFVIVFAVYAFVTAGTDVMRAFAADRGGPVAGYLLLALFSLAAGVVRSVLGPLAADGEHETRLRDTLRVFLATGGSFAATAERLTLHRTTVQYRVRRAEEAVGHPIQDHRADVELALRVCQVLGSAVLLPSAPQPRQ